MTEICRRADINPMSYLDWTTKDEGGRHQRCGI